MPRFPSVDRVRRELQRRALVALNQAEELPREAICRLALGIEDWPAPGKPRPPAELPVKPLYRRAAGRLLAAARELEAAERRRANSLGARLVTLVDPDYPAALRELPLPPPVLACRGVLPRRPAVAIVGSRAADAYGREAAYRFARELAAAGLAVVSGLARGIDTEAHRGALAAQQGRTVAVLGCGLAVDYPRGSARLRDEIAARGAVLSELPCTALPHARNFPVRNRIIAALAAGTLVVQGEWRSGSLITAGLALELGREVWAVPGRIFDRRSAGPNGLIRDGALPVQEPRDILDALPLAVRLELPQKEKEEPAGGPHGNAGDRLLAAMTPGEPQRPEGLATACGLSVERVLALLLELELAGAVRREPGPAWCRRG